jgi:hypothetical protein
VHDGGLDRKELLLVRRIAARAGATGRKIAGCPRKPDAESRRMARRLKARINRRPLPEKLTSV